MNDEILPPAVAKLLWTHNIILMQQAVAQVKTKKDNILIKQIKVITHKTIYKCW